MSMKLVSRVTGRTILGKSKSMEKSRFHRTTNWRTTWKKGFHQARDLYLRSSSFYNKVADRDNYSAQLINHIESIDGWKNISFLAEMHAKLRDGRILSDNQDSAIYRFQNRPPQQAPEPEYQQAPGRTKEEKLQALRDIWVAARRADDEWTMRFVQDMAERIKRNQRISPNQANKLGEKEEMYLRRRAATDIANRYLATA